MDLHSHVGLVSAPVTAGALELDSPNGPVLPWLRSVDALPRNPSREMALAQNRRHLKNSKSTHSEGTAIPSAENNA